MPYKLRWFNVDPLTPAKNRGPGLYYGRGHNYFAKYSQSRDKKIAAFGSEIDVIGIPLNSQWRHVSDGKLRPHWKPRVVYQNNNQNI
jgi:hypothetical protein